MRAVARELWSARLRIGLAAALAVACDSGGQTSGPDPDSSTLLLPTRVHVLSTRIAPLAGTLSDEAIGELIARVNEVWAAADIEWRLESVVREAAAAEADLEEAIRSGTPVTSGMIAAVFPRGRLSDGWDVFIVRDLAAIGAPGLYFPSIPLVVSSELDPAGLDDPGRILAHELGHSLTLPHVPCTAEGNLMAPNCPSRDRTRLTSAQVRQARTQAELGVPTES